MFPATEDIQLLRVRGERKPYTYYCRNTVYLNGGSKKRSCGRFLMRALLEPGCYIEIRCPKCGRMSVLDYELQETTEKE